MTSRAGTALRRFLLDAQRLAGGAGGELGAVLLDLAGGVRDVAALLARGSSERAGRATREAGPAALSPRTDAPASRLLLAAAARSGLVAAVSSTDADAPHLLRDRHASGGWLLAIDPLDGSRDLDANAAAGTLFSILPRPPGEGPPTVDAFLQPGTRQACAGYAIYGPSTLLVLAHGASVNGFTLDPALGEFVLTHPDLRIPAEARELAVDAANERFWEPPVRRYVEECVAGRDGSRCADFNVRWVGSVAADLHRVLLRGGAFLHPRDSRLPVRPGRLRVLHQAAPAALVAERAGGVASTGRRALLDVVPGTLHERVPVILGSRAEVERIVRYHALPDRPAPPYTSPLFNERSLLRER